LSRGWERDYRGLPLDNLGGETSRITLVSFESLPYPVAPISPPRAGYGKDEIRITVKELDPLKEDFRELNNRFQRMGYKLIKNRYG